MPEIKEKVTKPVTFTYDQIPYVLSALERSLKEAKAARRKAEREAAGLERLAWYDQEIHITEMAILAIEEAKWES